VSRHLGRGTASTEEHGSEQNTLNEAFRMMVWDSVVVNTCDGNTVRKGCCFTATAQISPAFRHPFRPRPRLLSSHSGSIHRNRSDEPSGWIGASAFGNCNRMRHICT
jgi:hypothetical protein